MTPNEAAPPSPPADSPSTHRRQLSEHSATSITSAASTSLDFDAPPHWAPHSNKVERHHQPHPPTSVVSPSNSVDPNTMTSLSVATLDSASLTNNTMPSPSVSTNSSSPSNAIDSDELSVSGTDSGDASASGDESESGSESYVQDIGSPIQRDPSDSPHGVVPRREIQRTYDSSSEDEGGEGGEGGEGESVKMSSGGDGAEYDYDYRSGAESNGNGDTNKKTTIQRERESTNSGKPEGCKNKSMCKNRANRWQLVERVEEVSRELAALQVTTAGLAADADISKISVNKKSSSGALKNEVYNLRITLDHVARLVLENAYALRDELEQDR